MARATKPAHTSAPGTKIAQNEPRGQEADARTLLHNANTDEEVNSDDDDSIEVPSSDEGEDMNDDDGRGAVGDDDTGADDGEDDGGGNDASDDDGGDEAK
jgi:hypothetical protein